MGRLDKTHTHLVCSLSFIQFVMKRPLIFFFFLTLWKSQVVELILEYTYCVLLVMSPTKTYPLPQKNDSVI